jgi:tRNA modification GTPase
MKLSKSFDDGKILKEGIKTAIIGKPNAGKSSLLNAILQEERAIVTEYEGTTRDTIEEFVTIKGIPLKLIDTAGIREAKDEVEKIGIKKSKEIADSADLLIAIFDSSKELVEEDVDILDLIKNKKSIIILNKCDLEPKIDEKNKKLTEACDHIIKISALKDIGIDGLYQTIEELFNLNKINLDNEILITNIRQKDFINKALENVKKAKETINQKMTSDIIAIFIKDILEDLGSITGEFVTEDIINEIFSKFCLGK